MCALTPLAGVLAFEMDGVFIGATWSSDMRNNDAAVARALSRRMGDRRAAARGHGLWLALLVFLSARGFSLLWRCKVKIATVFG